MTDIITALGALFAGLAGCGWIFMAVKKGLFGGDERRANAAVALTGAAKIMVDELQEEVHGARVESRLARDEAAAAREETRAARSETRAARDETEQLRQQIAELRRLTDMKIARLEHENAVLLKRVAEAEARGHGTNGTPTS